MKADEERQRQMAVLAKQKLDKEIELKELHQKKRSELHEREIDACLSKLQEINSKLDKGYQNMNERKDERTAYLKT